MNVETNLVNALETPLRIICVCLNESVFKNFFKFFPAGCETMYRNFVKHCPLDFLNKLRLFILSLSNNKERKLFEGVNPDNFLVITQLSKECDQLLP